MDKKYDMLVFIGRFQPFHLGHKAVIDRALEISRQVLVLVGSANRSRSIHNPFTFDERAAIIKRQYQYDNITEEPISSPFATGVSRVIVKPLDDVLYNDTQWVQQTQETVKLAVLENLEGNNQNHFSSGLNDVKIGLIGCKKDGDGSNYYLDLFPMWNSEGVDYVVPINATDIRERFFGGRKIPEDWIPASTLDFLKKIRDTELYDSMVEAREFISQYKQSVHKYPRIEHTVDSVVIQSGHVLLIRRRAEPGKGMWALPGGFIGPSERLKDAALRELREETKLKVPLPVLEGSIRASEVFDDPNRSTRGRIITQAFLIKLKDGKLPKVKGSDDADKAAWVPLSDLDPRELYEDHYFIIQRMIGEL